MELEAEVHSHPHKVGHRWIDLSLALSALALSIGSIIISIQNEANMQRLVTANSWPFVELGHGNTDNGQAVIHFDVRDAGIGPAVLEKLVLSYGGQPLRDEHELLQRCCALGDLAALQLGKNAVQDRVLSAREQIRFLALDRTDANAAIWQRLNVERFKVDMSVCYASVFGERWITSLRHPKPLSVKSCEALQGPAFDADSYAPPP